MRKAQVTVNLAISRLLARVRAACAMAGHTGVLPAGPSEVITMPSWPGRVITTTTSRDGIVLTADERYRMVDDTLIVSKPGYVIKARCGICGTR
jgi:hypothetical protein